MITIRKINRENQNQIKELINLIFKTFLTNNFQDSSKKLQEKYIKLYGENYNFEETKKHLQKTDIVFYVEENGKAIGIIRGNKQKIVSLYIDPEHQKEGIGKLLLNKFEQEAKKQGSQNIKLKPSQYAYNFYIKQGFQKIDDKYLGKNL